MGIQNQLTDFENFAEFYVNFHSLNQVLTA